MKLLIFPWRSNMTCTHTKAASEWIDEYENDWGHVVPGHRRYFTDQTYEDIDLHRYRCTQCGEVFYYSGRARDFYEQGIKSPWTTGLK